MLFTSQKDSTILGHELAEIHLTQTPSCDLPLPEWIWVVADWIYDPQLTQCRDVMSDAHNKTEIWQLCTSVSPKLCIWVGLPQRQVQRDDFFIFFFNSCSERGRILPCVSPSSVFINTLGEHCKERGRAGIEKRFKANYYHPAQWLPNSCCQEQQLVCPSFLFLPFPTLFFYCLVKFLLSLRPL